MTWAQCWPTDEALEAEIEKHGSITKAAKAHGVGKDVVRRHLNGDKKQTAGRPIGTQKQEKPSNSPSQTLNISKDSVEAEFVEADFDPNRVETDEELLAKAQLDPEVWEVTNRRVSVWQAQGAEGEEKTLRSLRIGFGKIKPTLSELVLPAFDGKTIEVKAKPRRKENRRDNELVVIVSDFHAPYHDEALLEACEQMLRDVQCDRLVVAGDLVDFSNLGRHRKTTNRCQATANECVQAGGEILARLRAAVSDDCQVQFIPGNHDAWLNNYLLGQAGAAVDLCVSGSDIPVWSLENLFQMSSLGIDLVGEADTWPHSYIQLTDHLVVKHGETAKSGSGASPLAEMKASNFGVIHGHTHRQAVVGKTVWGADGSRFTYQGAEVGAMCQIDPNGWPTYTNQPDWSPGFATVSIEKDQHYVISLASWQNGVLCWQGERY